MSNIFLSLATTKINFNPLPQVYANQDELDKIFTLVFGLAGSIALLVIVIGGLRYILSRGEPEGVAKAKNTILYGAVGLIVTFVAGSIVAFVINLA